MSRRFAPTTWICLIGQRQSIKSFQSTSSKILHHHHLPRLTQTVRTIASSASIRSPAAAATADSASSSSSSSSSSSPEAEDTRRWQLFASVIVERPRIVGQERNRLQEEFQTMLDDYEHEKAMKSDHEMRIEQDIRNMERKRKGLEIVNEPLQTGFEYEEDREKLHDSFFPAARLVNSDDLSSMNRLLDEKLYLFVPHCLGSGDTWFLPSSSVEGKLSLREAADDALAKTFGSEALEDVTILGNAPSGFYKYRYPLKSQERQTFTGGKFFLYKAFLKDPRSFIMDDEKKRLWLAKAEMADHLKRNYRIKIASCLFDY